MLPTVRQIEAGLSVPTPRPATPRRRKGKKEEKT